MNKAGIEYIRANNIVKLDDTTLGAMKNEYPLNNDQSLSSISEFTVFNKKVY